MKYFSQEFRSELTPGKLSGKVALTIIIWIGWFLIQNLSEYIPKIYKTISQGLYDKMIVEVSHGEKNYSALIFSFGLYFLTLACLYGNYSLLRVISERLKKMTNSENVEKKSPQDYIKKIKILKIVTSVFLSLSISIFVLSIVLISTVETQAEMTRDFKRKIEIITPYTTTEFRNIIISDFALMQNESDYNRINAKLNSVFLKNKLKP